VLNHCYLEDGSYQHERGSWDLAVDDQLTGEKIAIKARAVVNCAGVWVDKVNAAFDIESPYKHILSKGVFLGLRRDNSGDCPLVMGMGEHGDVINSIPWGPVVLWGPTETAISDIEEGLKASAEDIKFLMDKYNRFHKTSISTDNIVSIRCGIRPLAVNSSYAKNKYPLEVSRRHRIAVDNKRPWVSVYGSKLTGCEQLAIAVAKRLAPLLPEADKEFPNFDIDQIPNAGKFDFPGLDNSFPEIRWSKEYEHCCTIEDYLRRRTNIAQWVAREGLGRNNEHEPVIRKLCLELTDGDETAAERQFEAYRTKVERRFDQLLANVNSG
jgi:glycerol-3-phosphate dehydrogenase